MAIQAPTALGHAGELSRLRKPHLPALTVDASANAELQQLVAQYEQDERHLCTESNRLGEAGVSWNDALGDAMLVCGRQRAEIALFPVSCLADIMLKVRAFAITSRLDDSESDVRITVEGRSGHAYEEDVARAIVVDLMRLGGTPCA